MKMSKVLKLLKTMGIAALAFAALSLVLWGVFGFQEGGRIGCRPPEVER